MTIQMKLKGIEQYCHVVVFIKLYKVVLGPVVQKVYNSVHRINRYPVDKYRQNKPRYPLDSDLSGG